MGRGNRDGQGRRPPGTTHGGQFATSRRTEGSVALPGTGQAVRGYPALVDEGETVGVRVLETPEAQRAEMAAGTRRLLLLGIPSPIRAVQSGLTNHDRLTLAGVGVAPVLADATICSGAIVAGRFSVSGP